MTQKMIRKRDGRLVEFHTEKIRNAIWRSFLGVGQTGMEDVSDALAGHFTCIRLPAKCILTALAQDCAKDRGIRLERE